MKIILLTLTFLLAQLSEGQQIFEKEGKLGIKDANGTIVLAAEYDSIRTLSVRFPEAPYFRLVQNGKHGLIIYAKDSFDQFQWYTEECIYDSFVMHQGNQDDWELIIEKALHKDKGPQFYSVSLIKDGNYHFFGAGVRISFPYSSSPFHPRDEDAEFEYISYFLKNPNVYDSVLNFGNFEMYYNENGYKLYGFEPLKFRPDWYYTDSNGVRKNLPIYRDEFRTEENKKYPPRYLNYVSHIIDGKLSLLNWLGNQTPYDFKPGDVFGTGDSWISIISSGYPLRFFDAISMEEIHFDKYVGEIYNTDEIKNYWDKYYFKDSSVSLILYPTYRDPSNGVSEITYKKDKSHRSDIRSKDYNFTVINFAADTAIQYSKELHRFDILDGRPFGDLHSSLKERGVTLYYDPFIADYSLEGNQEYCIPFTLINMKSGRSIGSYKLKRKYNRIEVQEPHFDTLMKREYVEFFFERRNPAWWINGYRNYQKQHHKSFAVYDPTADKMYRSIKHWYRRNGLKVWQPDE